MTKATRIRAVYEPVAPHQCECRSMEWKGYNSWYIEKRRKDIERKGWNEDQCNRVASYVIDGKQYCQQHAGGIALKILLEET